MNKRMLSFAVPLLGLITATVHAAPGEHWEVTNKMEMKGMPFAMPAQTARVCFPQGGEKDPRRLQKKDSNCEMTDLKVSGNKTSYKVKCINNGETMTGEGETTYERDSFHGTMHITATGKQPMEMTTISSGKRVGGACDTEEMTKKAQAIEKEVKGQMDKLCDTSHFDTAKWVSSANLFIAPQPACPGKKEAFCQVVRNDAPHDVKAFEMLVQQEQVKGMPSAAKACNADIEGMKKTLCKENARRGPLSFLDANCPAEAKAYRELARKREECQGRGYTSGEKMKACMGGTLAEEDSDGEAAKPKGKQKPEAAAEADKQEGKPSSITGNPTADTVLEGAKKLKGLFKF